MSAAEDLLRIGTRTFRSRLIVGTGKYPTFEQTREALDRTGRELGAVGTDRRELQPRAHLPDTGVFLVVAPSDRVDLPQRSRHQVLDAQAQQVLDRTAEHLAGGLVGERDLAGVGHQDDRVRGSVEQRPCEVVAVTGEQ